MAPDEVRSRSAPGVESTGVVSGWTVTTGMLLKRSDGHGDPRTWDRVAKPKLVQTRTTEATRLLTALPGKASPVSGLRYRT